MPPGMLQWRRDGKHISRQHVLSNSVARALLTGTAKSLLRFCGCEIVKLTLVRNSEGSDCAEKVKRSYVYSNAYSQPGGNGVSSVYTHSSIIASAPAVPSVSAYSSQYPSYSASSYYQSYSTSYYVQGSQSSGHPQPSPRPGGFQNGANNGHHQKAVHTPHSNSTNSASSLSCMNGGVFVGLGALTGFVAIVL